MAHSSPIPDEQKLSWSPDASPNWLHNDPRWCLAERIVAGTHFSRSPLLSKFLLFIVAETIEGRENEISEHQIGVNVFDRRSGYSTVEDNIVRNYARQLRKRLAEHFADEGIAERLRIVIPLGGYIPTFVRAPEAGSANASTHASRADGNSRGTGVPARDIGSGPQPTQSKLETPHSRRGRCDRIQCGACLSHVVLHKSPVCSASYPGTSPPPLGRTLRRPGKYLHCARGCRIQSP